MVFYGSLPQMILNVIRFSTNSLGVIGEEGLLNLKPWLLPGVWYEVDFSTIFKDYVWIKVDLNIYALLFVLSCSSPLADLLPYLNSSMEFNRKKRKNYHVDIEVYDLCSIACHTNFFFNRLL